MAPTDIAQSEWPGAAAHVPRGGGIDALRQAASTCRGCELHEAATQTVFSKGSPTARLVLVGEQPGDQEDRQGAPFVGPAGGVLDRALAEAGIDRSDVYVTNTVKHFRFEPSASGRRIHRTPGPEHVRACRAWLSNELAIVDPEVVVALGATAAKALLGDDFRVTRQRGLLFPWRASPTEPSAVQSPWLVATIHPSAVLRADNQEEAFNGLAADLMVAKHALP